MLDKQILVVLFIIVLTIVDEVTKDYKLSSFKVNSAFHILNTFFCQTFNFNI